MAYLASDFFGRTQAAGTTLGTSSDGNTWTTPYSNNIQMGSNGTGATNQGYCYKTGASSYAQVILGALNGQNFEVMCRFRAGAISGTVGTNAQFGLTARYVAGGTNSYMSALVTLNDGALASKLQITKNGGDTGNASNDFLYANQHFNTVSVTTVAGQYYWLKLRVNQNTQGSTTSCTVSAKIWADPQGITTIPEPMNWTVTREITNSLNTAGTCGLRLAPIGTTIGAGIAFDNFTVSTPPVNSKFDYFVDLANWRTFAYPDGSPNSLPYSGTGAPSSASVNAGAQGGYAYGGANGGAACANGYITLQGANGAGGFLGRANINGTDPSVQGSQRSFYLQSVKSYPLIGTWAWKVNMNGPIYAGTNGTTDMKIVKTVYLLGGVINAGGGWTGMTTGQGYYEADYEFCLEPGHSFINAYANASLPCVLTTTYTDGNGAPYLARPCQPTAVNDILNGWITCVVSVTPITTADFTLIYKTEYLILSNRSGGQYTYLGSTTTSHGTDIDSVDQGLMTTAGNTSAAWGMNAYLDMHYIGALTSGNVGNPHQMNVAWFYYSATPNDYPSVTA